MTGNEYHVVCPISKERMSYPSLIKMRMTMVKAMKKSGCHGPLKLFRGRRYLGSMWSEGDRFYYRAVGQRNSHKLTKTGHIDG